jgi:hypothetical protein
MYHGPLRITTPPASVNDDLVLNSYFYKILGQHSYLFKEKSYQDPSIVGIRVKNLYEVNFLKKSFVYVVTETVSEYPYRYFTEKTWKAMVAKVPFMIVGSQHSLTQLHKFGFKTFDQWWSEDYDNLPTSAERIEALYRKTYQFLPISAVGRIVTVELPALPDSKQK